MFVLTPISGFGMTLLRLRQACEGSIDMIPLDYPDLETVIDPGYTFEQFIQSLARQIQEIDPHGSIRLTGYSWGGYVAYAVAVALIDAGRQVCFLGILDTPWSVSPRNVTDRLERLRFRLDSDRRNILALYAARLASKTKNGVLLRAVIRWSERVEHPSVFRIFFRKNLAGDLFTGLGAISLGSYREAPRILKVPTFLFRSEEHKATASDDLGWAGVCLDLQIIRVPGDHNLMDPRGAEAMYSEYIAAVSFTDLRPEAAGRGSAW